MEIDEMTPEQLREVAKANVEKGLMLTALAFEMLAAEKEKDESDDNL